MTSIALPLASKLDPRRCMVCKRVFTPKRKSTARICSSKCRVRKVRATRKVLKELGDYYDQKAAKQ
jgi:hypothetical protein